MVNIEYYILLLNIISISLIMILAILLIIAGIFYKTREEIIQKSILLTFSGILIAVSLVVPLIIMFLFILTTGGTPSYIQYNEMIMINILTAAIFNIFSFGVLFILLGIKNREENGVLLIIFGVLYSLEVIMNMVRNLYFYSLELQVGQGETGLAGIYSDPLYLNLVLIGIIFGLISLVGKICFIIFSIKRRAKLLIVISIWILVYPFILMFFTNILLDMAYMD